MSQEKLLPINPTRWPTLIYQDIGKSSRSSAQFVVLSYEEEPFSDKSRFQVSLVKTLTNQSDNLAHFELSRKFLEQNRFEVS
jgi:hypothetical protein